jgi:hypothetical protein
MCAWSLSSIKIHIGHKKLFLQNNKNLILGRKCLQKGFLLFTVGNIYIPKTLQKVRETRNFESINFLERKRGQKTRQRLESDKTQETSTKNVIQEFHLKRSTG